MVPRFTSEGSAFIVLLTFEVAASLGLSHEQASMAMAITVPIKVRVLNLIRPNGNAGLGVVRPQHGPVDKEVERERAFLGSPSCSPKQIAAVVRHLALAPSRTEHPRLVGMVTQGLAKDVSFLLRHRT